jgi:hypothetical protein
MIARILHGRWLDPVVLMLASWVLFIGCFIIACFTGTASSTRGISPLGVALLVATVAFAVLAMGLLIWNTVTTRGDGR